ncbi:MAG: hypothetical protein JW913_00410 [Chitinispirillaceae bacterium]|nr:hypothetical protein [Chitinispirillaceae bacterium]
MREDMKRNIEDRNLGPEQIFAASLIAGMSSFGILNQAVVSGAADKMGEDLAEYYKARNPTEADEVARTADTGIVATCKKTVNILQSLLRISNEITCDENNGVLYLKIRNSKCRYCPKGVGRAELGGTLCPFPSLIEKFVNVVNDRAVITVFKEKSVPLLKKEDDWCVIRYSAPG